MNKYYQHKNAYFLCTSYYHIGFYLLINIIPTVFDSKMLLYNFYIHVLVTRNIASQLGVLLKCTNFIYTLYQIFYNLLNIRISKMVKFSFHIMCQNKYMYACVIYKLCTLSIIWNFLKYMKRKSACQFRKILLTYFKKSDNWSKMKMKSRQWSAMNV